MIRIPHRLRNISRGRKQAALIWVATTILLDQVWLRLIVTHYPTAAPKHMVRIGMGTTFFFIGQTQAWVNFALQLLCVAGAAALLFLTKKQPDVV